jgi:two-component system response regulator WspF
MKIGAASKMSSAGARPPLVVIGASAGGPAALAVLLKGLPANFPAAIVIVQHVDERFVDGLASWLGEQCSLPVRLAQEGERPEVGTVLVAGHGGHLTIRTDGRLAYVSEPRTVAFCPSIDVFFQSVCERWPGSAVGVLLTGMGADGALGLKALRLKGLHTIAQDQATSAVYGMPKAAAAAQAAVDILPLDRIAPRLARVFPMVATGDEP